MDALGDPGKSPFAPMECHERTKGMPPKTKSFSKRALSPVAGKQGLVFDAQLAGRE
jgi:hypothetical protein